jgi:UDP-2,4-diacetamido-2,4,6-trideoxy-beta-L-altropyranose hydrolase
VIRQADYIKELASSSLAILAAGSSLWEAAALGVPSIGLIVADNQMNAAQAFLNNGLLDVIDCREGAQFEQIVESVAANLANAQKNSAHHGVIGQGVENIIRELQLFGKSRF